MSPSPLNRAAVSGAVAVACLAVAGTAVAQAPVPTQPTATLVGRAVLPANTFAPGPPSGTLLGGVPSNGVTPPFASQPVQGISGILRTSRRGTYLGLADNGFGAKTNSATRFQYRTEQPGHAIGDLTSVGPTTRRRSCSACLASRAAERECRGPTTARPPARSTQPSLTHFATDGTPRASSAKSM